jgi:hypothetical protein
MHSKSFEFTYQDDSDVKQTEQFSLPHRGYLRALRQVIKEKLQQNCPYNVQSLMTPAVIGFCLDRIESQHVTRSKKAIDYLTLAQLMMVDKRHATDNAFDAVGFLTGYVPAVSNGITRPATDNDFFRQGDVAGKLIDIMAMICRQVRQPEAKRYLVEQLIRIFSPALATFFSPDLDMTEAKYWDTRDYSGKNFMRVLQDATISVPEFFKAARLRILKEFARDAFKIATSPEGVYSVEACHGIAWEFRSINTPRTNGLGTGIADPIHLASDENGNSLVIVRPDEKNIHFIFNYCGNNDVRLTFVSDSTQKLQEVIEAQGEGIGGHPSRSVKAILNFLQEPSY